MARGRFIGEAVSIVGCATWIEGQGERGDNFYVEEVT